VVSLAEIVAIGKAIEVLGEQEQLVVLGRLGLIPNSPAHTATRME
jgi:hypothetical protein